MRLLVKLQTKNSYSYDKKYYHKLRGFVLSLLKNTEFGTLHSKRSYKFFSFSNIFPFKKENMAGEKKSFIIASPNDNFIEVIHKKLESINIANIGEMQFGIREIKKFKINLRDNFVLRTTTPVVLRIPERNYTKYGIKNGPKNGLFWRPSLPFEVFVKQLEENIIKKYNEFYKVQVKETPIFEQFIFNCSTKDYLIVGSDKKEQIIIGSKWRFLFSYLPREKLKLLEFAIDAGFGERNSYGFGFVDVVK